MSKFKVVVSDYNFKNLEKEKEIIESLGAKLVPCQCKSLEELSFEARDADCLLIQYFRPVGEDLFGSCTRLRAVVRYGIGVDNIDIEAANRYGVMVVNVPDFCLDEVSDHAVAFILNLARKIKFQDSLVKKGSYDWKASIPLFRLKGKTVGLLGYGKIARLVAKKMLAFDTQVLFYDPFVEEDSSEKCKKVSLEELFSQSDFLSIHTPETNKTKHLLDSKKIGLMKKGSFLINTSRGGIIDTEALIRSLESGHLAGAALDVIEGVPPISLELPICRMENVILTPHSAWYSEDSIKEVQEEAAKEVKRVLKGEVPKNLLNPDVLKKLKKPYGNKRGGDD
ncbi:MAG: C-terminal binding protein [Candidatus Aminicenantales bacterium]